VIWQDEYRRLGLWVSIRALSEKQSNRVRQSRRVRRGGARRRSAWSWPTCCSPGMRRQRATRSGNKGPSRHACAGQRLSMVPRAGLEPARPFEQSILSAPCLPFHHPGEVAAISIPGSRSQHERVAARTGGRWNVRNNHWRESRSVEVLVGGGHPVPGVSDVVHPEPVGRARYAGRGAGDDDHGVALDATAAHQQRLIDLLGHLVGMP
jgi:hypothetical protein